MIKYCTRCLYPETKPDLSFDDEGVCSACRSFEGRKEVDWALRQTEFTDIIQHYRSSDSRNYDALVPVSGGKDSTYQVIKLLENGLNPLCVTGMTDSLSDIGRRNIENIKSLGVDYIEVTMNPVIRRKINRIALQLVGDISWPEHIAIFTIPVRIAVQMDIPLIVWGENSQSEYGGPAAAQEAKVLNRQWLEEFGGLLGLRVTDLIGQEGIEKRHLIQYMYPTDEELKRVGVTGIFLGHYFPWDGYTNSLYAQAHGFETYPTLVEGSLANYENLDNHQTGIHDYFKFIKFGFGRATDIANNHIRRNRLLRKDALKLVSLHDGQFPHTCLGKPIKETLSEIGMTLNQFNKTCDQFTNKKLFKCNSTGELVKDSMGNLIKIDADAT